MRTFSFSFIVVFFLGFLPTAVDAGAGSFYGGKLGSSNTTYITKSSGLTAKVVLLGDGIHYAGAITDAFVIAMDSGIPIQFEAGTLPTGPNVLFKDYVGFIGVQVGHYPKFFDGFEMHGNPDGQPCKNIPANFEGVTPENYKEKITFPKTMNCTGLAGWGLIYINLNGPNLSNSLDLGQGITATVLHELLHLLGGGHTACKAGARKSALINLDCPNLSPVPSESDFQQIRGRYAIRR